MRLAARARRLPGDRYQQRAEGVADRVHGLEQRHAHEDRGNAHDEGDEAADRHEPALLRSRDLEGGDQDDEHEDVVE